MVSSRRRLQAPRVSAPSKERFFAPAVGSGPSTEGIDIPDLLHRDPQPWGSLQGSIDLVRFAFEGGDCAGALDELLDGLPLAPSSLAAESFASQLYLDELIESCLHLRVDGKRLPLRAKVLRRVLENPPANADDCATRQEVLRVLVERPAFATELQKVYVAIRALQEALETSTSAEPNVVRRKVNVLVAFQQCVHALADGFADTNTVLARLRELGKNLRSSEAWKHLVELVDIEGNLATVELRLRLGSDGTVRGVNVLTVREHNDHGLFPGPVGRFVQRVMSFLRGYRYGETELLLRLLDDVFTPLTGAVVGLLALTSTLQFYLAALGFRALAKEKGLDVSLPSIVPAPSTSDSASEKRVFEQLFNPLLFLQGVVPKPCTLPETPHDALVLLTGPNSGGKTRLLQALAISQLFAQAGLFVPAKTARIVRAPKLFLSLIAEDGASQQEGRLGTELLRIRRLFEQLEPGAVAVLDELCAGTNPTEGEEIFETVLVLLAKLRPQVYVSTHFLSLAARLHRAPPMEGLAFWQVELDARERPTFQFVPGVATTSLAHQVAKRLGVTREELEHLVRKKTDEESGQG